MISNKRKRFKCFLKLSPQLHTEVHGIAPDYVQWCWRMMLCWGGVNIQISKASKDQDGEKIEADNNAGKERQERRDLHRPIDLQRSINYLPCTSSVRDHVGE